MEGKTLFALTLSHQECSPGGGSGTLLGLYTSVRSAKAALRRDVQSQHSVHEFHVGEMGMCDRDFAALMDADAGAEKMFDFTRFNGKTFYWREDWDASSSRRGLLEIKVEGLMWGTCTSTWSIDEVAISGTPPKWEIPAMERFD